MQQKYIIGADEVGYGCWAGSLYVVALKAKEGWNLLGLNDSKKLSSKRRSEMEIKLKQLRDDGEISFALAQSPSFEIDRLGIADCLKLCYINVITQLYCNNSKVILDGTLKGLELKRVCEKFGGKFKVDINNISTETKADCKFPAVMAASIIAKTARDAEMKILQHGRYPNYGFDSHVGYGTKAHQEAIIKHGITPIHRVSFEPMKSIK